MYNLVYSARYRRGNNGGWVAITCSVQIHNCYSATDRCAGTFYLPINHGLLLYYFGARQPTDSAMLWVAQTVQHGRDIQVAPHTRQLLHALVARKAPPAQFAPKHVSDRGGLPTSLIHVFSQQKSAFVDARHLIWTFMWKEAYNYIPWRWTNCCGHPCQQNGKLHIWSIN